MPRAPARSAILLTYRRAVIRYEYKYEAGECGCLGGKPSRGFHDASTGTVLWANKLGNNFPGDRVPLKLGLRWKRGPRTVTTLIMKIRGFGRVRSKPSDSPLLIYIGVVTPRRLSNPTDPSAVRPC
ncbi:hypothetical protein IWW34DRAFT_794790 [Fusarium oxysporum f. sp. albedinis]|nr:hypothetical protein IWW34DRAFT_794790 [Fusarium oxysporum f. sp. albedinis]